MAPRGFAANAARVERLHSCVVWCYSEPPRVKRTESIVLCDHTPRAPQIRFDVTTGGATTSDIAIDTVEIWPVTCAVLAFPPNG